MKGFKFTPGWLKHRIGGHLGVWIGLALTVVTLGALGAVFVAPVSTAPGGHPGGHRGRHGSARYVAHILHHHRHRGPQRIDIPLRRRDRELTAASQGFSITPDSGYHVDDVLVDGSPVGAVTRYGFKKVTANHTIEASFARDEVPVDATPAPEPELTPTPEPAPTPATEPAPRPPPTPAPAPTPILHPRAPQAFTSPRPAAITWPPSWWTAPQWERSPAMPSPMSPPITP